MDKYTRGAITSRSSSLTSIAHMDVCAGRTFLHRRCKSAVREMEARVDLSSSPIVI
jgi:hypothetical protein